jgi:hypothetical protein
MIIHGCMPERIYGEQRKVNHFCAAPVQNHIGPWSCRATGGHQHPPHHGEPIRWRGCRPISRECNPEIVSTEGEQKSEECCLNIPDFTCAIPALISAGFFPTNLYYD